MLSYSLFQIMLRNCICENTNRSETKEASPNNLPEDNAIVLLTSLRGRGVWALTLLINVVLYPDVRGCG